MDRFRVGRVFSIPVAVTAVVWMFTPLAGESQQKKVDPVGVHLPDEKPPLRNPRCG